MTNSAISDVFSLLAKLMDIHQENSFKAKSYANAAFQIDRLPVELSELPRQEIAGQKGIGESTAKKIIELLETGELAVLQELTGKTPEGILELLTIKGIGPKKIATIWHELGVESPGELLYACNENRLVHYKGFGEKSQQSIKEALEFYFSNQSRFLYASLEPFAVLAGKKLETLFSRESVAITGDFRRQCDIVDTLEFIISDSSESIQSRLEKDPDFVLEKQEADGLTYTFQSMIPVLIYPSDEESAAQQLFFGSASPEFMDAFETRFPDIDYQAIAGFNEEDIFEQAGIDCIPPCLREDASVIEQAAAHALPQLITDADIRGIIHTHSTWSDGLETIETMARACMEQGYEYLVMSDHSVSSFYANGLSAERIRQQQAEIDRLNEKLAPFKIFKSIECDILGDGSLDYPDEVLESFDLVIVSVHQNLKMTGEKAMLRLMKAIEHPCTRILGHPTGRLLLSRKEYPVDHKALIDACKQHQVVIEINANPRRLDLDWRWIRYAMEQGVLLSVNPDAHSVEGIRDVHFGVISAQKGMLTSANNLSSMGLSQFENFLQQKQVQRK